jgi:hypothetical protein
LSGLSVPIEGTPPLAAVARYLFLEMPKRDRADAWRTLREERLAMFAPCGFCLARRPPRARGLGPTEAPEEKIILLAVQAANGALVQKLRIIDDGVGGLTEA